jgi:hypothetical protein
MVASHGIASSANPFQYYASNMNAFNLVGPHRNEFEEQFGYMSNIRDTKTETSRTSLGIF